MTHEQRQDDPVVGNRVRLDETDRRLIELTQAGLPLVKEPFSALGRALGVTQEEVLQRFRAMLASGVIRRIAAVPNHYALGYTANGMSVWDVDDGAVSECGRAVGALDFVSHCYRRPRRPPIWRYNLFAMVHARTRGEVEARVAEIAELVGARARAHEILYSTRILKKTGLRVIPRPVATPHRDARSEPEHAGEASVLRAHRAPV